MQTPLYNEHVARGARMVDFAGWKMPLLYQGIIPEHQHTRAKAAIFDICHMGEFELAGPTAEADLERLLTQTISSLPLGACSYGYMLNEQGGVLDDLICFRLASDRFWLVVNAGTTANDAAWIREHISASTSFNDLSPVTGKIDIQGPESLPVLEALFPGQVPALKFFRFQEVVWQGIKCLLSRTGYTGEWGYELYLPANETARFWKLLLNDPTVQPVGLGARDTLRVEMGFPLYGHELSCEQTPVAVSQGRFMDLNKKFIGSNAVARELENPDRRVLTGLLLEGRMAARAGDQVFDGTGEVGVVTSGLFAPSLSRAVALALVHHTKAAAGTSLEIHTRGKRLPAKTAALPLYTNGSVRRRPA